MQEIEKSQYALPGFEGIFLEPEPLQSIEPQNESVPPVFETEPPSASSEHDGLPTQFIDETDDIEEERPGWRELITRFRLPAMIGAGVVIAVLLALFLFGSGTEEEAPRAIDLVAPASVLDDATSLLKSQFEKEWTELQQTGGDAKRFLAEWKTRLLTHQAGYEKSVRTREALIGELVKLKRIDELYYGLLLPHGEMMDRFFAANSIRKAAREIGELRRDLVWTHGPVTYAIVIPRDDPGTFLFVRFEKGTAPTIEKIEDGARFDVECSSSAPFGRECDIRFGEDGIYLYRTADGRVLATFPF